MTTGSAGALNVTISAVDRLSAPLLKMQAGVTRLGASLGRLGGGAASVSGLGLMARSAGAVARNLALIVPSLSAITAAGSIAGVWRLAGGWASMGAHLGRVAYRVQTTATALHVMGGAARLAGSSAEDLAAGLEGLGDALVDAVGGRDDTAVQYFRLLGITMRDASGNARTAADVLPEVADGIARIADPRLQARVMAALRLPAGMLPYLRRGAAGMREWEAEARRAGAISEEGAAAARQFELAQARLALAGQGLANVLASRLAPILVPLLNRLSDWLIEKGPQLGALVEDLARRFAAFVDEGGLTRLGERLTALGNGFSSVIDWMGGMENAAIALGVVLVARLVAPLAQIGLALGVIGAARLPAWALRLLGTAAGSGAVVGGTLLYGLHRMGEDYREGGAGTPEAQEQRRLNWADRARLGGFPDPGPAPDGPDAPGLAARLGAYFRRQWTPAMPQAGAARTPGGLDPEIERRVRAAAARHGVDPDYAVRIARIEGGGWNRVSPAGAVGPMQLMPGTARDLGVDPNDPDQNIDGGVRYLGQMLQRFGGNQRAAAAAYNAGPNSRAVQGFAETGNALHLPRETQGYLRQLDGLGAAPAPAAAAQPGQTRSVVELRFSGQVPPGLTATTRDGDGVRVQRPAVGPTP